MEGQRVGGGFSRPNDFQNGDFDRRNNQEKLINNIFGNDEEPLDPLDQELLFNQEDDDLGGGIQIRPEQKQFYAVNREHEQETTKKLLRGEQMVGRVLKISGMGFSTNNRLLKLNKKSLAYFRHIPADFNEMTSTVQQIQASKKEAPKATIILEGIVSVDELDQKEYNKYKKFLKNGAQSFKITYQKKLKSQSKQTKDLVPEDWEQSHSQLDIDEVATNANPFEEQKKNKEVAKDTETWYFVIPRAAPTSTSHNNSVESNFANVGAPGQTRTGAPSAKDWILNISILCRRKNPLFMLSNAAVEGLKQISKFMDSSKSKQSQAIEQGRGDKLRLEAKDRIEGKDVQMIQQESGVKQEEDQLKDREEKDKNENLQHFLNRDEDKIKERLRDIEAQDDLGQNEGPGGVDFEGGRRVVNNEQKTLHAYNDTDPKSVLMGGGKNQRENKVDVKMSNQEKTRLFKFVDAMRKNAEQIERDNRRKESRRWDLKFQNAVNYVIREQKDMSRNFLLTEKLLDHVMQFREKSAERVKKIVDNMHNEHQRRNLGLMSFNQDQNLRLNVLAFCDEEQDTKLDNDDTLFFFDSEKPELTDNFMIKLTHPNDEIKVFQQADEANEAGQSRKQGSNFSQPFGQEEQTEAQKEGKRQMGSRKLYKQFGREMLANDVIFDAILYSSTPKTADKRLRIPLTCLVDYKGFRAISIAHIEIFDRQPTLGFVQGGNYNLSWFNQEIYENLQKVGNVLNLRDNRHQTSSYQQQVRRIPLSSFIQVYKYEQGEEKDAEKDSKEEYMKHFFDFHFKELDYKENTSDYSNNYLLRTSEIFPYDIDPADSNMDYRSRDRVLRPELIYSNEKMLRADTKKLPRVVQARSGQQRRKTQNESTKLKAKDEIDQDNTDAVDLNMANQFLRESKLTMLSDLLDSLIIIPVDSGTLEEAFHIQGVNMRYLGNIARMSCRQHVKDLCIVDMIARTLKQMFNSQISDHILRRPQRVRQNEELEKQLEREVQILNSDGSYMPLSVTSGLPPQVSPGQQKEFIEAKLRQIELQLQQVRANLAELRKNMENSITEWLIDFMNLVFGSGEESSTFWKEVLLPEVCVKYTFRLADLEKWDKNLSALYFSLLEQMSLKIVRKSVDDKDQSNNNNQNQQQSQNQQPHQQYNAENNSKAPTRLGNKFANNQQVGQGVRVAKSNSNQQVTQEDEPMSKSFGKEERPFGSFDNTPYFFDLTPKTRTFRFRTLPYTLIAQKFRDYKNNGMLAEAFQACAMRKNLNVCLRGRASGLTTKVDLCQLQLEEKEWESAIQMAEEALTELQEHNLKSHAQTIPFYCILMQANYMLERTTEGQNAFTDALKVLDHHWGPYHPLHIHIYGVMAQLLILQEQKIDSSDATYLYKASLRCCMRILGPNHIQTGEVHMDYARLQLLKSRQAEETSKAIAQRNDALAHFMEAFEIYYNYFDGDKHDSLQTAEAAIQIAELLEEDKRFDEAFLKAKIASATYQNVYAKDHPLMLKAMWQELSTSYALKRQETIHLANRLFYALAERDHILAVGDYGTYERQLKYQELAKRTRNGIADTPGATNLLDDHKQNINNSLNNLNMNRAGVGVGAQHNNNLAGGADATTGNNNGANSHNTSMNQDETVGAASVLELGAAGNGNSSQVNGGMNHQGGANTFRDPFKRQIDRIKTSIIATVIMDYTRRLSVNDKATLRNFCDRVIFYEVYGKEGNFKLKKDQGISDLSNFHHKNLNPLRVASVRNLDVQDHATDLLSLYKEAAAKIDWTLPRDENEDTRKDPTVGGDVRRIFYNMFSAKVSDALDSQQKSDSLRSKITEESPDGQAQSQADVAVQLGYANHQEHVTVAEDAYESPEKFFLRLTKIFRNINFYNLLLPDDGRPNAPVSNINMGNDS